MAQTFFEKPILNSPYRYPARHWELDTTGQPTDTILPERRKCAYVTPVPKAKKSKSQDQAELAMEAPGGITVDGQTYDPRSIINEVRSAVDTWRKIPDAKNRGRHPGNRPAAPALASPRVQRPAPLLLPSRGRGSRHLAHRGRAQAAAV